MSRYVLDTGMTYSQLSKEAGIPYSTIQEYFSGQKDINKCSVGTLKAIATTLGMTMDYLYHSLTAECEVSKTKKYKDVKIPEEFRGSFWDRDFEHLDLDAETDFIIIRLFMHAGFKGVGYIEDTFSQEDIIHAVKTRRDLNPVVANFLKNRYNLNRCDMNYYTVVHDNGNDWR